MDNITCISVNLAMCCYYKLGCSFNVTSVFCSCALSDVRVATHLDNLQKSGILRVVREMCSYMWSITASIVLDTEYARKEFFTR